MLCSVTIIVAAAQSLQKQKTAAVCGLATSATHVLSKYVRKPSKIKSHEKFEYEQWNCLLQWTRTYQNESQFLDLNSNISFFFRWFRSRHAANNLTFYIDSFRKENQNFSAMKVSFNPLILWVTFAWCASKLLQWSQNSNKTVWQTGWNLFLDNFGKHKQALKIWC